MPSCLSVYLQTLQTQEGGPAVSPKVQKPASRKSLPTSHQWLPVVHKPISKLPTEKSSGIPIPAHFSVFHPLCQQKWVA